MGYKRLSQVLFVGSTSLTTNVSFNTADILRFYKFIFHTAMLSTACVDNKINLHVPQRN